MKIDKDAAATLLREESRLAASTDLDDDWVERIGELSRLCEEGVSKTHLAFLGTAALAKAMDSAADLYAIKPTHDPDNPNAFSARILCHGVLVPAAAELGFSIGVTGREPLNNQPYFRMKRLDDGTPVHAGGRAAFDYMLGLVNELQKAADSQVARKALRAFIAVRKRYQPRYIDEGIGADITPRGLVAAIELLVRENSENGKRAQAAVAGLMDVFAGENRVESGRINDPSRRHPGDICVRALNRDQAWEKAIEVRDKPVSNADVRIFGKKCVDMGAREAALVMVAEGQERLGEKELAEWAEGFGLGLTLFHGWEAFVDQALFWSGIVKPLAAIASVSRIHQRLIAVEAAPATLEYWVRLTGNMR